MAGGRAGGSVWGGVGEGGGARCGERGGGALSFRLPWGGWGGSGITAGTRPPPWPRGRALGGWGCVPYCLCACVCVVAAAMVACLSSVYGVGRGVCGHWVELPASACVFALIFSFFVSERRTFSSLTCARLLLFDRPVRPPHSSPTQKASYFLLPFLAVYPLLCMYSTYNHPRCQRKGPSGLADNPHQPGCRQGTLSAQTPQ